MENKINKIPNFEVLAEKFYEISKGETYNDVKSAISLFESFLLHRSIVK